MDRRLKLALVMALGAAAAFLTACMPDTPETEFSWGVNDHIGGAPTTSARTYAYNGENRAAPAPKPRPKNTPSSPPRTYFDAPNETASVAFAWPGSGKVIASFGTAGNGERNDGINIAMKLGAPIKAAAGGTVSYSGDALKDYGNLLLIKHDGGYVTAYAHAERLLVQRGDVVTQGQVIAYAGRTGDVTTPQLHFEIRHGTTPVDPDSFLSPRNS
jgi:murein DD-endopeptidase MepM/ murein hydrolase activator NlpD